MLVAWRHQVITWNDVDLVVRFLSTAWEQFDGECQPYYAIYKAEEGFPRSFQSVRPFHAKGFHRMASISD